MANTSSGTLGPGRYCGLNVTSNLTLTGGVYIFDCDQTSCPKVQGKTTMLSVKGATLTDNGAGTTLVFTCSTCTSASKWPDQALSTLANGNMCLTAPTSSTATTKGFVIMGDPSLPLGTTFTTWSNPQTYLDGTVYVPSGDFTWGGNATTGAAVCPGYPSTGNLCLQVIVNQLTMSGTSNFSGLGCSGLAGGGTGQKPIGSIVTLVQ